MKKLVSSRVGGKSLMAHITPAFLALLLGLINQKNGLSCDTHETLATSGLQRKYRF